MKLFSKTFYNPWNPHICVDGFGKYFVRMRVGFTYLYWGGEYFEKDKSDAYRYRSIEFARYDLLKAKTFIEKTKEEIKKQRIKPRVVE